MNVIYQHPIFTKLDLSSTIELAQKSEAGPQWNHEDALVAAELYRTFLWLCWKYPDQRIVPNSVIDEFWHLHILDTKKYAHDCQWLFGRMMHHNPFLGLRDDNDKLQEGFASTIALVKEHFPELAT